MNNDKETTRIIFGDGDTQDLRNDLVLGSVDDDYEEEDYRRPEAPHKRRGGVLALLGVLAVGATAVAYVATGAFGTNKVDTELPKVPGPLIAASPASPNTSTNLPTRAPETTTAPSITATETQKPTPTETVTVTVTPTQTATATATKPKATSTPTTARPETAAPVAAKCEIKFADSSFARVGQVACNEVSAPAGTSFLLVGVGANEKMYLYDTETRNSKTKNGNLNLDTGSCSINSMTELKVVAVPNKDADANKFTAIGKPFPVSEENSGIRVIAPPVLNESDPVQMSLCNPF